MPKIQYLDEALSLVQKCTTRQIKAVLRAKQDNEDVRLSAPRKEDLIQKNLRDALTSGAVPMTDVFRLIQDSEENGDQHISYWRIPPKLREVLEFEPVAKRLFGENWKQTVSKFPSLTLKPESYVVSDFRSVAGKPFDWVLKIYGQASINEAVGNLQPGENGSLWQEYKVVSLRGFVALIMGGQAALGTEAVGCVMFKRRRFPVEIILLCVCWYCKYGISYGNYILDAGTGPGE